MLPLDFAAYKADLHMARWLPDSARARIILWEYTAERTLEHPWLGIGVELDPCAEEEWGAGQAEGIRLSALLGRARA